jgi:regulator of PEP synthase PpsR (kinase-PPPase family)
MPNRTVFFISDGTGITAETFGKAILAQFEMKIRQVRLPFTDTADKAHQAVRQINHTAEVEGCKPIVFTTLVNMEVLQVIREGCKGMLLDMFGTFVHPLEEELGIKSHHRVGRFSDASKSKEYHDRIDAINFSLAHDDGQSNRDLQGADVILVGVSRSGKTPTSLYLAMQHGLKAANYPLIPKTSNGASCRRRWRPFAPSCSASPSSLSACPRFATNAGPTPVTPAWRTAAWKSPRRRR